ncbi:hypothetical protein Salat_0021300 [Sesamum alatum]|uniref:Uncharacterized protein n=1 Tax=Sesamum alatum TaxID=300844 RepID=A0AAE1YUT8_9LAMI|nr:hypothetical protein Salat_0021300 [Sesamum alatum]
MGSKPSRHDALRLYLAHLTPGPRPGRWLAKSDLLGPTASARGTPRKLEPLPRAGKRDAPKPQPDNWLVSNFALFHGLSLAKGSRPSSLGPRLTSSSHCLELVRGHCPSPPRPCLALEPRSNCLELGCLEPPPRRCLASSICCHELVRRHCPSSPQAGPHLRQLEAPRVGPG